MTGLISSEPGPPRRRSCETELALVDWTAKSGRWRKPAPGPKPMTYGTFQMRFLVGFRSEKVEYFELEWVAKLGVEYAQWELC